MKFYRQYDFPNYVLGEYGRVTIATAGCFVVSLANLSNVSVIETNRKLAKNKCFTGGNLLANKILSENLWILFKRQMLLKHW